MNAVDADGTSYREKVEGLLDRARRSGKPEKIAALEAEIALPPFPKAADYLWSAYWRLRSRVNATGFGIGRISWSDIDAFTRHSRMVLVPWEVSMIERLDDLYVAQASKKPNKE